MTAFESTSAKPIYGVSKQRYAPAPTLLSYRSPTAQRSSPYCCQAGMTQGPEDE